MNNITSISDIKNAIVLLETEQEVKAQLLRRQFQLTHESLKPLNLLKSAVHEISSTPDLTSKLAGITSGLGLGYLTRKIVVGASGNIYTMIFGSILQFGVTNLIARHSARIKSFSQFVNRSLFGRRKVDEGNQ